MNVFDLFGKRKKPSTTVNEGKIEIIYEYDPQSPQQDRNLTPAVQRSVVDTQRIDSKDPDVISLVKDAHTTHPRAGTQLAQVLGHVTQKFKNLGDVDQSQAQELANVKNAEREQANRVKKLSSAVLDANQVALDTNKRFATVNAHIANSDPADGRYSKQEIQAARQAQAIEQDSIPKLQAAQDKAQSAAQDVDTGEKEVAKAKEKAKVPDNKKADAPKSVDVPKIAPAVKPVDLPKGVSLPRNLATRDFEPSTMDRLRSIKPAPAPATEPQVARQAPQVARQAPQTPRAEPEVKPKLKSVPKEPKRDLFGKVNQVDKEVPQSDVLDKIASPDDFEYGDPDELPSVFSKVTSLDDYKASKAGKSTSKKTGTYDSVIPKTNTLKEDNRQSTSPAIGSMVQQLAPDAPRQYKYPAVSDEEYRQRLDANSKAMAWGLKGKPIRLKFGPANLVMQPNEVQGIYEYILNFYYGNEQKQVETFRSILSDLNAMREMKQRVAEMQNSLIPQGAPQESIGEAGEIYRFNRPEANKPRLTRIHYFNVDQPDIAQAAGLKQDRGGNWVLYQFDKSGEPFQRKFTQAVRLFGQPSRSQMVEDTDQFTSAGLNGVAATQGTDNNISPIGSGGLAESVFKDFLGKLPDIKEYVAEATAQQFGQAVRMAGQTGKQLEKDPETRREIRRTQQQVAQRQKNIARSKAGYGEEGDSDFHDVTEDRLHVGDPVIVTAPNEFEGKTGEIAEFSPSGKFVIVNLYNHGEHSMHLSDVEYNKYADKDFDEDSNAYMGQQVTDTTSPIHGESKQAILQKIKELEEHIGRVKGGYRLYSHKGKNLGTFSTKAGAEKHEREVQYFKHKESIGESRGGNYEELNYRKSSTDKFVLVDRTLSAVILTTNNIKEAKKEAVEWAEYDDITTEVIHQATGRSVFFVDGYAGAEEYMDEAANAAQQAAIAIAKKKEQGVAEGHADQQRKIFKKNGKPVGEVGIDRESSPGAGQWYMKCYARNIDLAGYDSYEEAVEELKHCLKQGVAEEQVNELSKGTLANYVRANANDQVQHASSQSFKSGKNNDKYNTADAWDQRTTKREKGMDRALNKLTREDLDEAIESRLYAMKQAGYDIL